MPSHAEGTSTGMSAPTPVAEVSVVKSQNQRRFVGALLGVLLGGVIWLAPTPQGLSRVGHGVIAILVFTVIFWVFGVLGPATTAMLMLALMILAGVKPEHALGAYAGTPFWILVVVLFYGYAMQTTGLAKRLSFLILTWFPPTYAGVMGAFFVIGLVLSPAIPSNTVRVAIMVPIAWAVVEALGIPPRSRGSALIIISTFEMAVVPGFSTLYGSLYGPVMVGLFSSQGYDLQWMPYARALTLPTILWSLMLLAGNWVALRPEEKLTVGKEFARSQLARLGKISRNEIITAMVVTISIVYWVGERWHHRPTYLIGMLALGAFAAFGIIQEKDFGGAISWSLVMFLGALFGLSAVVQQNKVTDWLAGYIVPVVRAVSGNVLILVVTMAVAMLAVRFMDPSGFLVLTVLFLPISTALRHSPISPIVLVASLLFAENPFWTTYENIWVAMTEGMTGNLAFEGVHRVRLAHVYAIASLITLAISVPYWWALGLLG